MAENPFVQVTMSRNRRSLKIGAADFVRLRQRSFQLFELLVAETKQPVSKSRIMDVVWSGRVISDDSITQAISEIRRALAPYGHEIVETISGFGYRLAVAIKDDDFSNASSINSAVAIEPFVCLSEEREMTMLAKGMSNDLGHYLAQSRSFRVLVSAPDTPSAQGCNYTVRGTLRRHRDNLRITVSVIDNRNGELVWTDQWDCPEHDFFDTQEKAIQAIANHLASPWSGQIAALSRSRNLERETDDLDAYALFQCGVAATETQSVNGMLEALKALKAALHLDPEYGQAWACLSVVYGVLTTDARGDRLTELTRLRIEAAKRAYECHPRSALAHLVGAKLAAFEGNQVEAKERLFTATKKASWNSDILAMAAGIAALNTDLFAEAIAWGAEALELSLTKPNWYHFPIGYAHFFRGEYSEARAALEHGPQTYPELLAFKAASEMAIGLSTSCQGTVGKLMEVSPEFSTEEYLRSEPWGVTEKVPRMLELFEAAGIPR